MVIVSFSSRRCAAATSTSTTSAIATGDRAQIAAGIVPPRRVYDLRHTFATFALRAGISTFDLSRYMGASLTMIDRHYGHLARDGREHAIRLLDGYADIKAADVQALDVRWTPQSPIVAGQDNGSSA
jgi:integrase